MYSPFLEVLPNAVHDQLNKGRDLYLVDVRPAYEYTRGHPPGAVSIPLERISQMEIRRELGDEAGRQRPLYLISDSGERAVEAATKLQQEGLHQCLLVRGGTNAWSEDYQLS